MRSSKTFISPFLSPYAKCYVSTMNPSLTSSLKNGLMIALEGCDASGKTTTLKLLSDHFNKLELPYKTFKFPSEYQRYLILSSLVT